MADIIITSDSAGGAIRVEIFKSPTFPESIIQPPIVPAGGAEFGGGPGATIDLGAAAILDLSNRAIATQQITSSTWINTAQQQELLNQINAAGPGARIFFVRTDIAPQQLFPPVIPVHHDPILFPKVPGLL